VEHPHQLIALCFHWHLTTAVEVVGCKKQQQHHDLPCVAVCLLMSTDACLLTVLTAPVASTHIDSLLLPLLPCCRQVDAPPISDGDYLTAWYMIVLPFSNGVQA